MWNSLAALVKRGLASPYVEAFDAFRSSCSKCHACKELRSK